MSLSNRQRAVGAVAYGMVRGMTEVEIVDRLSDDGLLTANTIITDHRNRTARRQQKLDTIFGPTYGPPRPGTTTPPAYKKPNNHH